MTVETTTSPEMVVVVVVPWVTVTVVVSAGFADDGEAGGSTGGETPLHFPYPT